MLFSENESLTEIWQSLVHELHRGALDPKHPFRYTNLGTIGKTGPEIRTVVVRSVSKELDFYIFTDFRSEKVAELITNPAASLHFYHPSKRVQVRIKARTEVHHQNELSQRNWLQVQGEAKKAYSSTLAPSTPIQEFKEAFDWTESGDAHQFTVLKIIPDSIEVLQLNGTNHLKISYSKTNSWAGQRLVP
ncbi:pyridoxamine 5'-phosphate oxidase family protein [Algoriphagus litoralis]|uniref:pyridoxamine 5'-phosphate oxidase family protein n=1 Tax=Algoriphagus litoralis TaxID=2202829 RepID=UPI000DB9E602|nr:pyridoxamine 5'-phosphate oxidase family protein [Algoriphagus litoralis]